MPKLAEFAKAYPEIVLEVTTSNDPVDRVAGQYDVGIQLGELIQRDMIAIRVSHDLRLAVVGSPEYFRTRTPPRTPHDLKEHAAICEKVQSRDLDDENERFSCTALLSFISLAFISGSCFWKYSGSLYRTTTTILLPSAVLLVEWRLPKNGAMLNQLWKHLTKHSGTLNWPISHRQHEPV